ncbi:uncharacterized protein [Montipora capricornis]|uniref:uncharacterized protein n=1 Tax=Montipora capricornis TaxID=246305 RepID=UPI0035F1A815
MHGLQMDHYTKTSSVFSEDSETRETCDISVKSGSKIRNIISQVHKIFKSKTEEKITLIAIGPSVTKAITCAEIIKRKIRGLHQLNKVFYTKTEDTWEPKEECLDKLQVTRRIPSISITLSKTPLDATQPGYQAPGRSKSPVQFGNEDWELSWEDDPAKEPKRTSNAHIHKAKKSKSRADNDEGTSSKSVQIGDEIACSNSEARQEKCANAGLTQERSCGRRKEHLTGAALKNEHRNDTQRRQPTTRKPKTHREHKPKPFPNEKQKSDNS